MHDEVHVSIPNGWACVCGARYAGPPFCGDTSGKRVCHLNASHPGAHLDLVGKTGKYQETWW